MTVSFSLDDIRRSIPGEYVARGRDYVSAGRVSRLAHTDQYRYQALVAGSRALPYDVDVRLVPGKSGKQVYGLCSCPMRVNCKHVAAVLLRALEGPPDVQQHPSPARPTEAPRGGARFDSRPAVLPAAFQEWLVRAHKSLGPAPPRDEYPLDVMHRLLYLLVPPDAEIGSPAQLRVVIARRLKNGGYSDVHPWSNAREAVLRPPSFVLAQDQRILRMLLLEGAPQAAHTFVLQGETGAEALRAILATGRCHLESNEAPQLAEGPPRNGALRWAYLADGSQHIACDGDPPVNHLLPFAPPWYVDLVQGQCGPLETDLPAALAQALAAAPAVAPEHAALAREALSDHVGTAAPLPAIPEPPELREVAPVAHLRLATLQAYGRSYRPLAHYLDIAELSFDYEGLRIDMDSPGLLQTFRDGRVVHIKRDARAEKRAHDTLGHAGFVPLSDVTYDYPDAYEDAYALRDSTAWPQFIGSDVPRLRSEGWQVELDDSFRFRPVEVGEWTADVQEGGNDWFDLSLGVEIDGKRRNVLPILLTAIRARPDLLGSEAPARGKGTRSRGEDSIVVVLEDGRIMPVPVARIRALLSVLHELIDTGPVPKVRLPRLDAARLVDLEREADLKWSGGESLRAFGAKLADFSGVEPVAAPRALRAELRPYQAQGVAWLQFLRSYGLGGILADDMGLGKTVEALAHVLIEQEAGRLDRPALVIAPTSVVPNWKAEITRFAPGLRVHVSHGLKRKRTFAQLGGSDLVLTTYPLLARDKDELLAQEFHLVILDEAQQIKNAKTQAAKVVQQIKARHRLCLTGTPMENHLGELWSLFHFLMPGFLGEGDTFRRLYRTPIEKRADEPRRLSLARRIRPFVLRRTKEEVAAELPEKNEIVETIELSDAQGDLYETVRAAMDERVRAEIAARGLAQSQIVVLDALLKLRQICCDPRLLKLDAAKRVKDSAKLARLLEMLEELLAEGRRVLLFSQFTSMLELIEQDLKARGVGYVKLTGETRDRKKPVDAFQSGKAPLFLISLKAGGTGLNLTAADTVIHYDPWWNPAVENQATDRAHRIGQDKPVFVYKLIVAGSVEEKIAQLQTKKAALAAGVLGAGGAAGGQLTREDIAALFEPM
jgi:superfamily II DNA or RNA helicase